MNESITIAFSFSTVSYRWIYIIMVPPIHFFKPNSFLQVYILSLKTNHGHTFDSYSSCNNPYGSRSTSRGSNSI